MYPPGTLLIVDPILKTAERRSTPAETFDPYLSSSDLPSGGTATNTSCKWPVLRHFSLRSPLQRPRQIDCYSYPCVRQPLAAGIGIILRSETVDIWGNQKFVVASLLDFGTAQMSGGVQIVTLPLPHSTTRTLAAMDYSTRTSVINDKRHAACVCDVAVGMHWHLTPCVST
jgi:hypothetical protein